MPPLPIGLGAWKRSAAGEPEIRLVNRYVEKAPTNLQEKVALIGRPGTVSLDEFDSGSFASTPIIRGTYWKPGLFEDAMFVVSGNKFYRKDADGTKTQITGTIYGTGHPYVAWSKGAGYEYLFIADGLLLQYYNGGTHAVGTLTVSAVTPPNIAAQVVEIGGIHYSWSATPAAGTQDGTSANPWLAKLGANDAASLVNLANLIQYAGIPGTDFSASLPGPNLTYTATSPTATTVVITATSPYADGNAISTTVFSGADLSWGGTTLAGGNTHALSVVETPDGAAVKSLAALAGFVLASIGNTRRFYFIEPGDVVIDPLNFAEKESQPDNIEDMLTVGDAVFIMGGGSSEWWYATGDADAPFAPTKGQAYQRGVLPGSAVVVKDSVILVGDDNIVYEISGGGAKPISTNSIVERVRSQVRREQGLP